MKNALNATLLFLWITGSVFAVDHGLPGPIVSDRIGVQQTGGVADYVDQAGIKLIRNYLYWTPDYDRGPSYPVETRYNWDYYDAQLASADSHNVRVLWTIMGNQNEYGGGDPRTEEWRNGFATFAAAAAEHFSDHNCMFEVWNEPENFWPNLPVARKPWDPLYSTDPNGLLPVIDQYMVVLNRAVPAMKAANPNCTILAAATSATNDLILTTMLNFGNAHPAQKGLLDLVDAVSVHPYQRGIWLPEDVVYDYEALRNRMDFYKPGSSNTIPIVSTEWGYSVASYGFAGVGSYEKQADYAVRSLLVNLSEDIPLSIYYSLVDTEHGDAYEDQFGLVDKDWWAKPSYYAVKNMSLSLQGTTFTERLSDGVSSDDWLLVFTSPNGQKTLAAWTTGEAHTINHPEWGELNLSGTPFYVNPAPEPATMSLLAVGGLALLRRRK